LLPAAPVRQQDSLSALLLRTLDGRPIRLVKVSARDNTFEYAFE
jgi:hypothetical protein